MIYIAYLTRNKLRDEFAQASQIISMYNAFNKSTRCNIDLYTPDKKKENDILKNIFVDTYNTHGILSMIIFSLKCYILLLKKKYDLIYTRDILIAFIFTISGTNVIYECHKNPKFFLHQDVFSFLKRFHNFYIIAISNALRLYLIKKYNMNNVIYYHDGVDIEKYDNYRTINKSKIRKELNIPIEKKIMLHSGSLYRERGIDLLSNILEIDSLVFIIFVGGRTDDIKYWKNYYNKYDNIKFIGHIKDKNLLIKYQMSADYLFYPITVNTPTYWCCSPLKLFEYMATGIPILNSNIGSIKEILNDKNSYCFDPSDKIDLVNKYKYMITDSNSKNKANLALDLVKNNYTWDIRVNFILDFCYNEFKS